MSHLALLFLCIIIWFLVAVWVAGDASNYDMSPFIWFLLTMFGWILGIIGYLIVRSNKEISKSLSNGIIRKGGNELLRVKAKVEDINSGETIELEKEYDTDSKVKARDKFQEFCNSEGYTILGEPDFELVKEI